MPARNLNLSAPTTYRRAYPSRTKNRKFLAVNANSEAVYKSRRYLAYVNRREPSEEAKCGLDYTGIIQTRNEGVSRAEITT